MRIALIGCSKTKQDLSGIEPGGRVSAAELYTGPLFKKRVQYAELKGIRWFVISAKFGLLRPDVSVLASEPKRDGTQNAYDLCMADLSPADQAIWHVTVASDVIHLLWGDQPNSVPINPRELIVEIHAGAEYARPLATILASVGVTVKTPVAGLGIGEQLGWYSNWLKSMQPAKAVQ